mmetsp:Transcript_34398/g.72409  ORF Transcript_34398/g.72409 Transcript_34398/m.72409 type:complete len:207 (-) Transcript_34398:1762-2382(-)
MRPDAEAQYFEGEGRSDGRSSDDLESGRVAAILASLELPPYSNHGIPRGRLRADAPAVAVVERQQWRHPSGREHLVLKRGHEPRDVPVVKQRQEGILLQFHRRRGGRRARPRRRRERTGVFADVVGVIRMAHRHPTVVVVVVRGIRIVLLVHEPSSSSERRRRRRSASLVHPAGHFRVQHDPHDLRRLQQESRVRLRRHHEEQRKE